MTAKAERVAEPTGDALSVEPDEPLDAAPAADVPDVPAEADAPAEPDVPPAPRGFRWPGWARGRRGRLRIAAGVVLAALLLTAGVLRDETRSLRGPGATANRALTDTDATARLTGDVSDALARIFAYTPDDTASTAQAARDLLDGTAAGQYQALFAQIRQHVAEQRLTLTTRVVRAGVVTLTADHARLLVFLDQTAQRAGSTATSAAAQLSVSAEFRAGRWRITDLKAR